MKTIRTLILKKLKLSVPGIHIHQIRINRHLPEARLFRNHHHLFSQVIIYLEGGGHQIIESEIYPIRPGSVFFIPKKKFHSFQEFGKRRPLCLIIDLEAPAYSSVLEANRPLSPEKLRKLKSSLGEISKIYGRELPFELIKISSILFDFLYDFFCFQGDVSLKRTKEESYFIRQVRSMIRSQKYGFYSLAELAKILGYQKDHFNRLLKQRAGMTFGQLESREFLKLAQEKLLKGDKIMDVSNQLGFPDQNYFARWFRRQTEVTPTVWKNKS